MENISFFCGPSTWIFVFIKPSLYGGILVTKISEICLFLYIVKNEARLGINFCGTKLHDFFEFDQKFLLAK